MSMILNIVLGIFILVLCLSFYIYITKYSCHHLKNFAESDDTKEFKRKVNLVLENAKTIEHTNNALRLLENLLDIYKDEYKVFNTKISDEYIDFMFLQLDNYMRISVIERQSYLIQRKLNENVI